MSLSSNPIGFSKNQLQKFLQRIKSLGENFMSQLQEFLSFKYI